MRIDEYVRLDATELAALVRSNQVSAGELLALARERQTTINPTLNAVIRDMRTIADARVLEELDGPFAGVPFLLKDLAQDYAGEVTSYGSRALSNYPAEEHSEVVRRWLRAGLVIFGKTSTPEFGSKGVTESVLFGATRNPWNTERTPGGSSGGSAAAVAAGIVPAAGANDGGGSIRIPAACCGLVGLKPSRGFTPFGPTLGEMLHGMAVQGVVSRTVRDSAALLDAIAGPEPTAAFLTPRHERPLAEQIVEPPKRLKIGFCADSAVNAKPHPEAVAAVESAAEALTELGHEVEAVQVPYDDLELSRDFLTIWFADAAFEVALAKEMAGTRNRDFEPDTLVIAELGRAGGSVRAARALEARNTYVRAMVEFHERYDLLLTPTLAKPPLKVGELQTPRPLEILSRVGVATRSGKLLNKLPLLDQMVHEHLGWVPYTQLANVTGRPAISVPLHWTADDLPLGVQFVGQLGDEGLLLQLAAELEQARPWLPRFDRVLGVSEQSVSTAVLS